MTITELPALGTDVRLVTDLNSVNLSNTTADIFLLNCPSVTMPTPGSSGVTGVSNHIAPLTRLINKRESGATSAYQADMTTVIATLAAPGDWCDLLWTYPTWTVLCRS
jgi:hypothetical protein